MVNFTEKLEANTRTEWASHYVDYKALKKAMKKVCSFAQGDMSQPLLEEVTSSAVERFGAVLQGERDKVQQFYEAELQRITEEHRILLSQLKSGSSFTPSEASSMTNAAINLYRTLQHLRNYCILNYTGLLKAAKKFDKATGSELLATEKKGLDLLSFVHNEEVDYLASELEIAFANAFCEGSVQVAHSTLLVRKERAASLPILSLGVRLGCACMLLVWIAWDSLLDPSLIHLPPLSPERLRWVNTQLPLYRCAFTAVLCSYACAACLYVWNKHRINYQFLFDIDSSKDHKAVDAAALGTRLALICLLSLMLLNKAR